MEASVHYQARREKVQKDYKCQPASQKILLIFYHLLLHHLSLLFYQNLLLDHLLAPHRQLFVPTNCILLFLCLFVYNTNKLIFSLRDKRSGERSGSIATDAVYNELVEVRGLRDKLQAQLAKRREDNEALLSQLICIFIFPFSCSFCNYYLLLFLMVEICTRRIEQEDT